MSRCPNTSALFLPNKTCVHTCTSYNYSYEFNGQCRDSCKGHYYWPVENPEDTVECTNSWCSDYEEKDSGFECYEPKDYGGIITGCVIGTIMLIFVVTALVAYIH